jgi:hypothetical protein
MTGADCLPEQRSRIELTQARDVREELHRHEHENGIAHPAKATTLL